MNKISNLFIKNTIYKKINLFSQQVDKNHHQQQELQIPTVNFHLAKDCNYKCTFCFAHFDDIKENLGKNEGLELIKKLKEEGNIHKINFAGGEPFLNQYLGEYVKYSKNLGVKTSLVTNATKLTKSWLLEFGQFTDQIAVSCDSLDDNLQKQMGRGFGQHTQITQRAFKRIREYNYNKDKGIAIKLNTVVTRQNYKEDWTNFILENKVQRWKIFKVLLIKGENDSSYDQVSLTDKQFQEFVSRHEHLKQKGVDLAPENNDEMIKSYIMINPQGQFYQNSEENQYLVSEDILKIGVLEALKQVDGFEIEKFISRGGQYSL